jgi:4-aminobutyrate aminotransferase-like enzyme
MQANASKIGDLFITELVKLRDEFEVVGDVRGKGLMLGAELVKSKVRERERGMDGREEGERDDFEVVGDV